MRSRERPRQGPRSGTGAAVAAGAAADAAADGPPARHQTIASPHCAPMGKGVWKELSGDSSSMLWLACVVDKIGALRRESFQMLLSTSAAS